MSPSLLGQLLTDVFCACRTFLLLLLLLTENIHQEIAHGLREVVDERGVVIGLLEKEVEDLKAALIELESQRPPSVKKSSLVVDPRLEEELKQARQVKR